MSLKEYVSSDGIRFTDEDIERWAAADESPEGYTGGHLGPPVVGRPVTVGEDAKPFTLRLDGERRAKLAVAAALRDTTQSQVVRDLIDSLDL